MSRLPGPAVVAASWLAGAVPFSNIAARRVRGVDLRSVGSGTVSGSGLLEVAGFRTLATTGIFEVAKGALGPALAGRDRPGLAALAGGAAVVGHDWSPFLRGAGGRGISPAMGAMLVTAPMGTVVLLGGIAIGRPFHVTATTSFIADVLLVPVVGRVHGRNGATAAAAVLVPLMAKRIAGNKRPADGWHWRVVCNRLLFDRDERKSSRS